MITRNIMNRFRSLCLIAGGIVLVLGGRMLVLGQNPQSVPVEPPMPTLMLAKLASTQAVAAGLVSQDFDRIRQGANELVRICDASLWEQNVDQVYMHHRVELRRQAMKLARMADDQNLDGAAFAYMNSMATCISCHQHCRDVLRIADRSPSTGGVIRIPATDPNVEWNDGQPVRR
jgi:hypothetical protein